MTSTTKTVIASTTAAAVVATGVFVGNYSSNDNIDWDAILPDIEQYSPQYPDMAYNSIVPDTSFGIEDIGLNIPTINDGFSSVVALNMPTTISGLDISNYLNNGAVIESIELFSESGLDFAKITFSIGGFEKIEAIVSGGEYDINYIKEYQKHQKIQQYFSDKRSVNNDYYILDNAYLEDWFEIYETFKDKNIEKISIGKSFRMISEVKMPKNMAQFEILEKNLNYYKSRGYDSVLITFDSSEKPSDLKNLVKYIRHEGFRVYFAFAGNEDLSVSVFVNPEMLKEQLKALAEYSEGFLLAWRRTSAHLIEQDIQYMNYMSSCVREANSKCLILGEVYFGNTAKYPKKYFWGFGYNLPTYASAAVVCNFGFEKINIEGVVKYLIPKKIGRNVEQIPVVVGERAYYLSTNKNNLSQEKNQKIKESLEKRFINSGCRGTITLHGDGRDNIEKHGVSNNMSEIIYSSLK